MSNSSNTNIPPQYYPLQGQPNNQQSYNQPQYPNNAPQYPNNVYQQSQGFPQQGYPIQSPYPMQGQMPSQNMPQQFTGQMPVYNMPDANQMMSAYQEHKMSMGRGGSQYTFVKFLGPNNESKWESASVPIGHQSVIRVFVLPPWAPGKYIFAIALSHFWKSVGKPQGASLGCPGADSCRICQVARLAIESSDPSIQKRAKDWGSVNTNFLYQVALLDTPQIHFNNGQAQPVVLRAGATLHKAIGNLLEERSVNICDPQLGRPIRIKKTKTGPGKFDVEYSCIDEDPQPLPQPLWGLLNNLIDLESVFKNPTEEEMQNAIIDMGLGNIGGFSSMQYPNAGVHQPYSMQNTISPMMSNPTPQPNAPNLVPQPQQNINPPPVSSGNYNGPPYYPQPSQQNTLPQQPIAPNVPFNRSPIKNEAQNVNPSQQMNTQAPLVQQQPMTLQQLQDSIRGNNGK
jgi:hypothetical protein